MCAGEAERVQLGCPEDAQGWGRGGSGEGRALGLRARRLPRACVSARCESGSRLTDRLSTRCSRVRRRRPSSRTRGWLALRKAKYPAWRVG